VGRERPEPFVHDRRFAHVKVNLKTDRPLLYQRVARQDDPGQRRNGRLRLLGNDFYTTSGVHLTMGSYDSVG
jgi:hypothetical protein